MHLLQIRTIMHKQRASTTIPRTYTQVHAVVWECGEEQTDTQTVVTNIHFASSTPHTKCNKNVHGAVNYGKTIARVHTVHLINAD